MNNSQAPHRGFSWQAFFSLGFRPFYLAGSLYAVLSMLVWIGYLFDFVALTGPMDGVLWHAHELIFGFAAAILIGFLFTASQNWTKLPTPSGYGLAGLLLLWALGRFHSIVGLGIAGTILDLAFLPLAALAIAKVLISANNHRNYFALLLLVILSIANGAFYSVAYGLIDQDESTIFMVAVDVFAIFITIIGGRIIPLFSNNATGGKRAQRHQGLEHGIVAGMALILISDLALGLSDDWATPRALLMLALALLHGIKMAAWRPHITLIDPILWILPLSYLWLPISLTLRAASLLDAPFDQYLGLHAMTAGAMGSMMLAMMTRSSLGHTGRKITAGWAETGMFVLISTGAAIRIFGPLALPDYYLLEIGLSGLFWMAAFALFSLRYWSILTRPRASRHVGPCQSNQFISAFANCTAATPLTGEHASLMLHCIKGNINAQSSQFSWIFCRWHWFIGDRNAASCHPRTCQR